MYYLNTRRNHKPHKKKKFNFNLSLLEFNFTYTTDNFAKNSQKIRNMKILFQEFLSPFPFELVSSLPSSRIQEIGSLIEIEESG